MAAIAADFCGTHKTVIKLCVICCYRLNNMTQMRMVIIGMYNLKNKCRKWKCTN